MSRLNENYVNGLYALGWPVSEEWVTKHIPESATSLIEGLGIAYANKEDVANLRTSKLILADWLGQEDMVEPNGERWMLSTLIKSEISIADIRGDAAGAVDSWWLKVNDMRRSLVMTTLPAPIMCIDGEHAGEWHYPLMDRMMIGKSHYWAVKVQGVVRFVEREPAVFKRS